MHVEFDFFFQIGFISLLAQPATAHIFAAKIPIFVRRIIRTVLQPWETKVYSPGASARSNTSENTKSFFFGGQSFPQSVRFDSNREMAVTRPRRDGSDTPGTWTRGSHGSSNGQSAGDGAEIGSKAAEDAPRVCGGVRRGHGWRCGVCPANTTRRTWTEDAGPYAAPHGNNEKHRRRSVTGVGPG